MAEYKLPLLRALSQLGGSAPRWQVKDAVEGMLAGKLTDLDLQSLQSGEVRWGNRLGFARLRAIERGHVRSDSQRGLWELTDAGIEELGRLSRSGGCQWAGLWPYGGAKDRPRQPFTSPSEPGTSGRPLGTV